RPRPALPLCQRLSVPPAGLRPLRRRRDHAWVEALLPGLGWIGFDPTNNLVAGERHIRVALGRDYADVQPTRGVFRGAAESQPDVAVQVTMAAEPQPDEHPAAAEWSRQEREAAQQSQQQ
ncbi:MAG TPA: transglutaminase family protein, partial [Herpetosiphonaceae bacterium]